MGFWKRLFGLEKEPVITEQGSEVKPDIEQAPTQEGTPVQKTGFQCEYCKEDLLESDNLRTFMNKKWHKKCLKKSRKEAFQKYMG